MGLTEYFHGEQRWEERREERREGRGKERREVGRGDGLRGREARIIDQIRRAGAERRGNERGEG